MITCPICQKEFKSLMSHIRGIHYLTIKDFLTKYPNYNLVSKETRNSVSKSCKGNSGRPKGFIISEETRQKMSNSLLGDKNGFYGKKHSLETRERMKKNHSDFNGKNNPFKNKYKNYTNDQKIEYKKMRIQVWNKIKQNPEKYLKIRQSMSERATKQNIDGKYNVHKGYKSGFFSTKKNKKNIFYRSSFELCFLENSEIDDDIKTIKNCDFSILYKDLKGDDRRYVPDFMINENIIVETKTQAMLSFFNNKEKIEAAKKYCKEKNFYYVLIMENELNRLKNGEKVSLILKEKIDEFRGTKKI